MRRRRRYILIGVILFVVGLVWESRQAGPRRLDGPTSFLKLLSDLIGKLFVILTGRAKPWKKLQAFGMLLIFLGFAFLLASGVAALWSAFAGSGTGTDPTPTPTPTST